MAAKAAAETINLVLYFTDPPRSDLERSPRVPLDVVFLIDEDQVVELAKDGVGRN
jgi:hypothetical protein